MFIVIIIIKITIILIIAYRLLSYVTQVRRTFYKLYKSSYVQYMVVNNSITSKLSTTQLYTYNYCALFISTCSIQKERLSTQTQ